MMTMADLCVFNKTFWGMEEIPDSSVQLIFADPPYNISSTNYVGKKNSYTSLKGEWDILTQDEEHSNAVNLITDAKRVLTPTGTICISGNFGSLVPYWVELHKHEFKFKHHLIWRKPACAPCVHRRALTLSHEIILIFSKNEKYYFDYEISKTYNDNKQLRDVWDIPAVRKQFGATRKPPKLLERLITIYSAEGDVILDPFMGSGTTFEEGVRLGRYPVGYELQAETCKGLASKGIDIITF